MTYGTACLIGGDDGRAIRGVLDRIGDKWTLLVVAALHGDCLRFTEIQQHIPGISQRMLTLTLRHLERDGLVARTVFAQVPPRVEYELTEVGRTLVEPAAALTQWALTHNPHIERSHVAYDSRPPAPAKAAD